MDENLKNTFSITNGLKIQEILNNIFFNKN